MTQFRWTHDDGGFVFTLLKGGQYTRFTEWANIVESDAAGAVSDLYAAAESEAAVADETSILVSNEIVAGWSARTRRALGMPTPSDAILELGNEGTIDLPDFKILTTWRRPNGQVIIGARRTGALLKVGGIDFLLPASVFRLAHAIDAFSTLALTEPEARFEAWGRVQSELPEEAVARIRQSGYLGQLRFYPAHSLSLKLAHGAGEVSFEPVVHGASVEDDAMPLLPEAYQKSFADQVGKYQSARAKYALGHGHYVVLPPPLVKALEVVRRAGKADVRTRADFARNPRAALKAALGDEYPETVIETLFTETGDYSARVREIGLWAPKVLPWVVMPSQPWLPPERGGLLLGTRKVEMALDEVRALLKEIEQAKAKGETVVKYKEVDVPVSEDTIAALQDLEHQLEGSSKQEPSSDTKPSAGEDDHALTNGKHVLIIKDNHDDLGFEVEFKQRNPTIDRDVAGLLSTKLKQHQIEGLEWLQAAWQAGRSGVLLADDMGLGKTLQALAFLAWLRRGMLHQLIPRAPFLIVAPTGLLGNWQEEAEKHLGPKGLGTCLKAYGPSLADIRLRRGQEIALGEGVLDESKLVAADWVLTTYETARDYQFSFGRVPFAVAVLDEAQKIKTPGTITTEATKALKVDFVIAMTGTPIENRLADLWCIVDAVQPGRLGELKVFSARYEREGGGGDFAELKNRLNQATAKVPQILLRRMKEDRLEGLPERQIRVMPRIMPEIQANAYRAAIADGRAIKDPRKMLKVLQSFRSISLHPFAPDALPQTDEELIASSARYQLLFEILDEVAGKREKALIFLEFLADQATLAGVIQRRYKLDSPPMLINGSVSGDRRLERVNRFQAARGEFDAMILSPRAGGVGLTLTAANHVIHLTRWWNPAVEDQCTDRIYRIGQDKPISVYLPMALLAGAEEHSFDQRLHELLERKRSLSRAMLSPAGATEGEMEALFTETTRVT